MVRIDPLGIILANDLVDFSSSLKIVEVVEEHLDGLKLGIPSMLENGRDHIKEIKKRTKIPLIADFKVADIGFMHKGSWSGTNSKIITKAAELGFDYITFHPFPGMSSTKEAIYTAHKLGIQVLAIPYMTAEGAELFFSHPLDRNHISQILEYDIDRKILEESATISELILGICQQIGVDGFIGPANRPEVLHKYRKITKKPIFTTGIGRQGHGDSIKDQLSSVYSICGGSSAAIIGSAIYTSPDPLQVVLEIKRLRDEVINKL